MIGYVAAQRLAAAGRSVLLLDFGSELVWETTRALENGVEGGSEEWRQWVAVLSGGRQTHLSPAWAEVRAADLLLRTPGIQTVFFAMPVAAEREGTALKSITLATKSGLKAITAGRWVDASENGDLLKLCGLLPTLRQPETLRRSLYLHSDSPEALKAALPHLPTSYSGLADLKLSPASLEDEYRLSWRARGNRVSEVTTLAMELRALAKERGFNLVISQMGWRDYPIYAESLAPLAAVEVPENLTVLSPALGWGKLVSLEDRFALGGSVPLEAPIISPSTLPQPKAFPAAHKTVEVVIAGSGTAGAVAAIAAARAGANTLTFDFSLSPGGIAAGGGITGYFHGADGGIQNELDDHVMELTEIFAGETSAVPRWHHDAKKLSLLQKFENCGVEFFGGALLCEVERDGNGFVRAILVAHEGQLLRICATAWVDSTGDGDLAAMAGAEFTFGRAEDRRPMAYSQVGFWASRAEDRLLIRTSNFDAGWVDPSDAADMTRARLTGLAHYLTSAPSDTERLVAIAPLVGLRQSRQIHADYMVTLQDMIAGAQFDDAIGAVATVADTHSVDFEFETETLAFYYWTCRGFRHRLHCDLPYRMLLPKGLKNVWIACRAAGINMEANTGLRMQREMQRFGEAAGFAAALSLAHGGDSRAISSEGLLAVLDGTGARSSRAPAPKIQPAAKELLALLDSGMPGVHLWQISQRWPELREATIHRLAADHPYTSFYAAVLCALAHEPAGEARLIHALETRESGPTPEEFRVPGAYGQCIDRPFWLQSLFFLRLIGTSSCLRVLAGVLDEVQPFTVLTTLALTTVHLAERLGPEPKLVELVERLSTLCPEDTNLPPTHSIWRTLQDEPQMALKNYRGVRVGEDHRWQLDLALLRARQRLGLPHLSRLDRYREDSRAFVRRAFAGQRG